MDYIISLIIPYLNEHEANNLNIGVKPLYKPLRDYRSNLFQLCKTYLPFIPSTIYTRTNNLAIDKNDSNDVKYLLDRSNKHFPQTFIKCYCQVFGQGKVHCDHESGHYSLSGVILSMEIPQTGPRVYRPTISLSSPLTEGDRVILTDGYVGGSVTRKNHSIYHSGPWVKMPYLDDSSNLLDHYHRIDKMEKLNKIDKNNSKSLNDYADKYKIFPQCYSTKCLVDRDLNVQFGIGSINYVEFTISQNEDLMTEYKNYILENTDIQQSDHYTLADYMNSVETIQREEMTSPEVITRMEMFARTAENFEMASGYMVGMEMAFSHRINNPHRNVSGQYADINDPNNPHTIAHFRRRRQIEIARILFNIDQALSSPCVSIGVVGQNNSQNVSTRIRNSQVGWFENSWGLHSDDGHIYHNTGSGLRKHTCSFGPGDVVGVGLVLNKCNGDDGPTYSLYYTVNGESYGPAWTDLPDQGYYFAVGLGAAYNVSMNTTGPFLYTPSNDFGQNKRKYSRRSNGIPNDFYEEWIIDEFAPPIPDLSIDESFHMSNSTILHEDRSIDGDDDYSDEDEEYFDLVRNQGQNTVNEESSEEENYFEFVRNQGENASNDQYSEDEENYFEFVRNQVDNALNDQYSGEDEGHMDGVTDQVDDPPLSDMNDESINSSNDLQNETSRESISDELSDYSPTQFNPWRADYQMRNAFGLYPFELLYDASSDYWQRSDIDSDDPSETYIEGCIDSDY